MFISSTLVAVLSLTSFGTARSVAGIHEQRQAAGGLAALQSSISALGAQLAKTNNTVVGFTGGGLIDGIKGLTAVNGDVVDLGNAITATTNVATNTPRLSPTDSTSVGLSFLALQPNINTLLSNLQNKRTAFDGAAVGLLDTRGLIHDSLAIQQDGAKSLGTALIGALDPSLAGIAQPINDQIQGNFTAALNTFTGRSGVIKIPTALVPTATQLLAKIGPALTKLLPRDDPASVPAPAPDAAAAPAPDVAAAPAPDAAAAPAPDAAVATPDVSAPDALGVTFVKGSQYCCGITQAQLDALGPDQNDMSKVPFPVLAVLKGAGLL